MQVSTLAPEVPNMNIIMAFVETEQLVVSLI